MKIHVIWIFGTQKPILHWVAQASLISLSRHNPKDEIYFWTDRVYVEIPVKAKIKNVFEIIHQKKFQQHQKRGMRPAQLADLLRYKILLKYGECYVDLDILHFKKLPFPPAHPDDNRVVFSSFNRKKTGTFGIDARKNPPVFHAKPEDGFPHKRFPKWTGDGEFINCIMYVPKGHQVLRGALDKCERIITEDNIDYQTGKNYIVFMNCLLKSILEHGLIKSIWPGDIFCSVFYDVLKRLIIPDDSKESFDNWKKGKKRTYYGFNVPKSHEIPKRSVALHLCNPAFKVWLRETENGTIPENCGLINLLKASVGDDFLNKLGLSYRENSRKRRKVNLSVTPNSRIKLT